MIRVQVKPSKCVEGDILAEEAINKYGAVLLGKGTVINNYIISKLVDMGVDSVWIYRENTESLQVNQEVDSKYNELVVMYKDIVQNLIKGKRIDESTVVEMSSLIFNKINNRGSVIKYLSEIRNTDDYTYNHSINTAFYSMLIGDWLKLKESELKTLIQAGLLHDIGKIKIPTKILNKKGYLTREEFELIKMHTTYGYDIVSKSKHIDDSIKSAILMHHEREDGSGYPNGIYGDKTELLSKIVSIADVYDAMISDRVYKEKVTPFEAFKMFTSIGLNKFDIRILNVFLKNMAMYYIDSNVKLNNNTIGKIVFVSPQDITHPIIQIGSEYIDVSRDKNVKIVSIV